MKPAEIQAAIAEHLGGLTAAASVQAMTQSLLQTYADQMNRGREKIGLVDGAFDEAKYAAHMKLLFGDRGEW